MDAGEVPFVIWRGLRVAMTAEGMRQFNLRASQIIADEIYYVIQTFNLNQVKKMNASRAWFKL